MKTTLRFVATACALALCVVPVSATEYDGEVDGPWINVDVIDLVSYGDAQYFEYLGKGYVAMLEAIKAEGA